MVNIENLKNTGENLTRFGTLFKIIFFVLGAFSFLMSFLAVCSNEPYFEFIRCLIYGVIFVFLGFLYKVMFDGFAVITEAATIYINEKNKKEDSKTILLD